MTIAEAYSLLSSQLIKIYDQRESRLVAKYILEDTFGKRYDSRHVMENSDLALFESMTKRLLCHEPWQYVTGYADFYGFKFKVNPSVLIPRPETEELVHMALQEIRGGHLGSVLDIGTGSGVIPVTIAKTGSKSLHLYGSDLYTDALETAADNAKLHHVEIVFLHNDILDEGSHALLPVVDMVISNPPYITLEEKPSLDKNVILYEPHSALFVTNDDALEFYRAIAKFVVAHQKIGCVLLVEINEKFGPQVCALFKSVGLKDVTLISDLQNKPRFVKATK
jgi:release factor glutamine methyltransferase